MDRLDKSLKHLLDKSKEGASVVEKENPCPSEETFACYLDNLLNDTEKAGIEGHFARCNGCLQQIVFLHSLRKRIKEGGCIETPLKVIEKAKALVPEKPMINIVEVILGFARDTIRVIKDTGAMFSPLEAVPLEARKEETAEAPDIVHLIKVFDSLKAKIIIEKLNDKTCEMEIITTDPATETPLDDIRLSLLSGERELASYLTVNGGATFKNLYMGKYTLVIIRKKDIIGKISLQLEAV